MAHRKQCSSISHLSSVTKAKEVVRIYDLSAGQYDVTCTAGASFGTKRAEGAAFLERVAGQNPELMKIIGDLVFKIQDMPYADEIAERLQKTLPPEMRPEKMAKKNGHKYRQKCSSRCSRRRR